MSTTCEIFDLSYPKLPSDKEVAVDFPSNADADAVTKLTTFHKSMHSFFPPLECATTRCIYGVYMCFQNYIQFNLANPDLQEDELLKALPHGARRSVLKNLYVPLLQDVDILEVGVWCKSCV